MKQVIFLCLLSLSVCLSKPAENQAAASKPTTTVESKTLNITDATHPTQTATEAQPAPNKEQAAPKTEPEKAAIATAAPTNETVIPKNPLTPSKEAPKPTEDNKTQNKEEEKKEVPKPKEEATPKAANETKPAEKASTVKPEEGKAKNGTNTDVTPKPTDATKTTEAPKSDKDAHIVQARGFDGPSFIGGIILTLGLLAIGFMGFKYYKNQTERNYHTL